MQDLEFTLFGADTQYVGKTTKWFVIANVRHDPFVSTSALALGSQDFPLGRSFLYQVLRTSKCPTKTPVPDPRKQVVHTIDVSSPAHKNLSGYSITFWVEERLRLTE